MHSKNIKAKERAHLARIKSMECGVCGAAGPSDAHHIEQGNHYLCIPLCKPCHQGHNGWHGTKAFWRIRKLDELDVLNATIEKLMNGETPWIKGDW